ncbi:hypothetical protein LXA43DRAFT_1068564 [Ganoderma leucocontextum]|nr:hypothetical protein LXA43DRAFT_1068564 [Ganoderma leucocontextum]
MTFRRHPLPALLSYPYPSDTLTGKHIPIGELRKYSKVHVWPDGIHCFCSLRPGDMACSVRLFVPSQGPMQGSPCLGCPDWTPDGVSGCRYFVNLKELFDGSEALFGTEVLPLQNFPIRDKRTQVRRLLTSSGAHPPALAASLLSVPAPPLVKPSAPSVEDYFPLTFGVKPGAITDPERIWSPPPVRDVFRRVEDMPLPAAIEVREVFDNMINGAGVPYRRLMAVIGGCVVCDQVMVLSNILTHPCIGRTKDVGPCPSKCPLLPEDRRTLPAAGSRIKKEPDTTQVTIKADNNDSSDIEFVDGVNGALKRKRKVQINTPPSQRVFVSAMKKPRITNNGGPSQATGQVAMQTEALTIDLTTSPVRIQTPEGSREVYRDWNEEFIMYEKKA